MSQFAFRISVAPLKDGVRGRSIGSLSPDGSIQRKLIYAAGYPSKADAENDIVNNKIRELNPEYDFKVVPW